MILLFLILFLFNFTLKYNNEQYINEFLLEDVYFLLNLILILKILLLMLKIMKIKIILLHQKVLIILKKILNGFQECLILQTYYLQSQQC